MRDSNGPYDLLIAGGEDHKAGDTGDAETRHARLWDWAKEMFPGVGPVEYRWAGEVLQTFDGLGFIGPDPSGARNVFVVTGDCGTGITTLIARLRGTTGSECPPPTAVTRPTIRSAGRSGIP
jgi:glycine/D-amino acid oxidase-like deaminating enzyme